MNRRRSAVWLLSVPLMIAGSELAHALAFRIVYPNAHARMRELLATGHGYTSYLPLVLAVGRFLRPGRRLHGDAATGVAPALGESP